MADQQLVVNLALKNASFDKQIKSAENNIKSLKTETKAIESETGNFSDSIEGLGKKLQQQSKLYDTLKSKLTAQQGSYDKTKSSLEKLTTKYQDQGAKIDVLKSKLSEAEAEYGKNSDEAKALRTELSDLEKKYETTGNSIINANNKLTKMENDINTTTIEINNLGREMETTQSEIDNFGEGSELDEFTRSVENASEEVEGLSAKMVIIGEGITNVGDKVGNFGQKIFGATTGIIKSSTDSANSLAEMQRKSSVVFGDMIDDVRSYAAANEEYLGLGSGTIEGLMTDFSDLSMGIGMTAESAKTLSQDAVEMSAMLGNWGNIGATQAMEDIQRACLGSSEAVEKYGIKLNENVLTQTAMNMGLGDNFTKLVEAEKAQVRYQAIVEASGNAINFWNEGNRNAVFYEQQVEEMTGNMSEMLGNVFLPVIKPVVEKIAELSKKLSDWLAQNPEMAKTIGIVLAIVAAIGGLLAVIGAILVPIGLVVTAMGAFSVATLTAALPVIAIIAGIVALIAILGVLWANWDSITTWISEKWTESVEWIKTKIDELRQWFTELPGKISEALQKLGQWFKDKGKEWMDNLSTAVSTGWNAVMNFFTSIPGKISDALSSVVNWFKDIGKSWMNSLKDGLTGAWSSITNWINDKVSWVKNIFGGVGSTIRSLFGGSSRSLEVTETVKRVYDNPNGGLDNIALRGSYYNANTASSERVGEFIKMSNNSPTTNGNKSSNDSLNALKSELAEIKELNKSLVSVFAEGMSSMSQAMREYVLMDNINLILEGNITSEVKLQNNQLLAKAVAPFLDKEMLNINKLKGR